MNNNLSDKNIVRIGGHKWFQLLHTKDFTLLLNCYEMYVIVPYSIFVLINLVGTMKLSYKA